jgi:hypothetical protein
MLASMSGDDEFDLDTAGVLWKLVDDEEGTRMLFELVYVLSFSGPGNGKDSSVEDLWRVCQKWTMWRHRSKTIPTRPSRPTSATNTEKGSVLSGGYAKSISRCSTSEEEWRWGGPVGGEMDVRTMPMAQSMSVWLIWPRTCAVGEGVVCVKYRMCGIYAL